MPDINKFIFNEQSYYVSFLVSETENSVMAKNNLFVKLAQNYKKKAHCIWGVMLQTARL